MTRLDFSSFSAYLGDADKNKQYKLLRKTISHKILSEINKFYSIKIDNNDYEKSSFYAHFISEYKAIDEEILKSTRFRILEPPDFIHWVGRNSGVFFDFRTCDEIETAAFKAGISFPTSSKKYLDFGCSSGRTLRTFQVAFDSAQWFGCDPVEESINWAKSELTDIDFQVSTISPPIKSFQESQFDGVYAISIWSHFREDIALKWFDEMYRILKKDGFLIFTTPGYHGLSVMAKKGVRNESFLKEAFANLGTKGFFFKRLKFQTMDSETWGLAHISPIWVINYLVNSNMFSLAYLGLGGHKNSQDIYVLKKC